MSSTETLAVAFDLGTTTIAASLVDTSRGERLASASGLNPQRPWGADVLARLEAAGDPEVLLALQRALAGEMEGMLGTLLAKAGAGAEGVGRVAVAGNPAMEQIALGLPVASLAGPPFRPAFREGRETTTRALGWEREFPAYLLPLPGGFVGGDLVAFLFGLTEAPLPGTLFLDLGTNAELALFDGERYLATSAAAGPAFEGGNLSCGSPALPGAIDSVRIEGDRVRLGTVGGLPPRGICGSGVLQALAVLLECGVVEPGGRLRSPEEIGSNLANRVVRVAGTPAFVLHRDARGVVCLDQGDLRSLQLAKGALRGGMEVLLGRAGLGLAEVSRVVLTGSFGAVLSPEVLKKIGIFTQNMVSVSGFVREGALAGVERMLLEAGGRTRLEEMARRVRVVPLSGTPSFERLFLANLNFPEHPQTDRPEATDPTE